MSGWRPNPLDSGDKYKHGAGAEKPPIAQMTPQSPMTARNREELLFWINCVGAAVIVVRKETLLVLHANDCAAAFFQKDHTGLVNVDIGAIIGREAAQMLTQVWSTAPFGKVGEAFIVPCLLGSEQRLLIVRLSRVDVEGEHLRIFTFSDAPPQGSIALAGWQDNMLDILNWFPFGFEIADHDDQIQFANAHCRRLFGYHQHELENSEDWWRLAYPDSAYRAFAKHRWYTEIEAARLENRELTPFDLDVTTASGEVRTIQLRHRTIGKFNVNLFLDVTQERVYERELRMLAATDPLTGVLNRRQFFKDMEGVFSADATWPVTVLMLDLDHFKAINDTHGHIAGDLVLQEFTRRCVDLLRRGDQLARLGGEEFAVILRETTLEGATDIAERLRAGIERHAIEIRGQRLNITISIGGASRLVDDTIDKLMLRVDKALYEAKHRGRNQAVIAKSK